MKVLVIGSGYTVERDLAQVDRSAFDKVIGVNAAAAAYGPVDVHVTLHPEKYAEKKAAYLVTNRPYRNANAHLSCLWTRGGNSGSSSLFAVKYALEVLKADYVLLAGVPMEGAHFNRPSNWDAAKIFRKTWKEQVGQLKGKVYSLSGWTARLLNGPGGPIVAGATGNQPEERRA